MRQTTTPTVRIRTNIPDLSIYDDIRIAVYCAEIEKNPIIFTGERVVTDQGTASVTLTQDETNTLHGRCIVEMRVGFGGNIIGLTNGEFYIKDAMDRVRM